MKKRINSSEIERAKKTNMFLFILTFLMLFVVVGGLLFYVVYDKQLIKIGNNTTSNEENIFVQNETKFDVKEGNMEVERLYDIVRITNSECSEYKNSSKVDTKKLSDSCKYDIASNIYDRYVINDNGYKYISEDDVSYAYESLFGVGKYKQQETIPYKENVKLLYNPSDNNYFSQDEINDTGSNMRSYEEILSVKKDNNYLYINTSMLYYDVVGKNVCLDYGCENIVDKISDEVSDDYFTLYIKQNSKKLYNYKYKFKLDKNGFYKYLGFERTNK